MNEPRRDDERLSALLAGQLEGPERDELLAYLSTADEDLEVFAHTAAILREMDEEDAQQAAQEDGSGVKAAPPPRADAPVPSMTKRTRGWPRRTPRWAILVAIVGLVLLGTLTWPRGGTPGMSPVQLAANIGVTGPGLPFDTADPARGIPGDRLRGGGNAELTPESAARAGAFLVRLALAIQARDSAATATLASQTQDRFDPRGGSALKQIMAGAGAPADELKPRLEEATERLEKREDGGYLQLGAWVEAGRFAAQQRNVAYFRSEYSTDMLQAAERRTRNESEGGGAAVAAIRRTLAVGGEPDWSTLEVQLTTLLEAIAT